VVSKRDEWQIRVQQSATYAEAGEEDEDKWHFGYMRTGKQVRTRPLYIEEAADTATTA
jgi:hypothetical protein